MQLMIYQMACEEIFKKKVSKLTYYFLNDNVKMSFTAKEKQLDGVRMEILDNIGQILCSKFEATPGWQCQYCDYKGICEFREL
jgi:CRISPR/Cas system-associated exonuclease Cas4 (RecB family)